jgi:H/ACA ribonucleoprotein complex non-core subunit NAF1
MGHAMSEPYDPHSGLTMPQQPQQFTAPNMYPFNPGMGPQQHGGMNPAWTAGGGGYPQPNPTMQCGFGFDVFQQQAAMGMMPFVQPHINPRFAGSFAGGFPGAFQQQQQQQPPNAGHGGQQYPPQNGGNAQQWPSQ